ncbi:hypothetical protein BC834DRAFT_421921 [Gloeopeniophorella convolvens]|nr:hypothetical protein BC834DRAFT_421921 [Gloeopeniophorella convolvens]
MASAGSTSLDRENHVPEWATAPRSLTWQPSPSRLRQVSSPEQFAALTLPSSPLLKPSTWSNLPIELVAEILLYAAFASRADAYALCLVSSAVRRAVLPALYHNVLLRYAGQVPHFVAPFTAREKPFAFPSALRNTKLLAHAPIYSLALALPTKRPSLESALARVAPALGSLKHLALTAPLLGAHAHWLRASHIRPHTVMLYHLGRPAPVHFAEPFLRSITHLHTSTLSGFRDSSLASLPALTHVALTTRATQASHAIDEVLASARRVLATCPNLKMLVLSLDGAHGVLPAPWRAALSVAPARQRDQRLYVLPYARRPRVEWHDIASGAPDVFDFARVWRDAEARGLHATTVRLAAEAGARNAALNSWKEDEWDLDMMTAPGYVHGRATDGGETDTPALQW